jgi:hypothetical protein
MTCITDPCAFEALLHNLEQLERQPERRLWPRYTVHAPVRLAPRAGVAGAGPATLAAWALDLSRGGMSLLTTAALPAGLRLSVDLRDLAGEALTRDARVVRCMALLPGAYRVGVVFLSSAGGGTPLMTG